MPRRETSGTDTILKMGFLRSSSLGKVPKMKESDIVRFWEKTGKEVQDKEGGRKPDTWEILEKSSQNPKAKESFTAAPS